MGADDHLTKLSKRVPWRTLLGIPANQGIPHGKKSRARAQQTRRRRRREPAGPQHGREWGKSTTRFVPGRLFLRKINDHELSCRTQDQEYFRDPTVASMPASSASLLASSSSSSSFSANAGWSATTRIPRSLSVAALSMPEPRFANLMSKPTTEKSLGPGAYLAGGPRSVLRLQPLPARRKNLHARAKYRASSTFKATERDANAPFGHMRTWADERNDRERAAAQRAARDRVASKKQQLEDEMEERNEAAAEAAEAIKLEETGQQEPPWVREANAEYRSRRRAIREKNKISLRSDNLEENFIKASLGYLKDLEKRKLAEARAEEEALEVALKEKQVAGTGGGRGGGRGRKNAMNSRSSSGAQQNKKKEKRKKGGSSGTAGGGGPAVARGIRIFSRDDKAEAEFLEWQKANSIASR